MFSGLADFAHAWVGFMNPTSIALGLGGALLGIHWSLALSALALLALTATLVLRIGWQ